MLEFHSANTRAVNPERAVLEAIELATGSSSPACGLVFINACVGHDVATLSKVVQARCPGARVLAASCAGVIGREGPGGAAVRGTQDGVGSPFSEAFLSRPLQAAHVPPKEGHR